MSNYWVPNEAGFRELESWQGPIGRDLNRRLRTLEFRARQSAGRDTGELIRRIGTTRKIRPDGLEGKVGTDVRYAAAHHQGARPHIIRARRARFLRFTVAGKVIFRRSVRHPGNRPNPFLTRWLREAVS